MEDTVLAKYKKEESDFAFGRRGMNAKYPNEFEVYMVALELVDSRETTIEYFSFPVMPFQITKSEPTRTTIKSSASGTTVISNDAFVVQEISIKGDFGRGFKLVSTPADIMMEGVAFKGYLATTDTKHSTFSTDVKTGFGAIKILQNIISMANKLDATGSPNRLYFYNLALSESYLVSVPQSGLNLSQEYSKNMIWEYSLSMSVLAPLEKVVRSPHDTSALLQLSVKKIEEEIDTVSSKSNLILKNYTKVLDYMKDTTHFDVSKYLTDFVGFVKSDYPNIAAYYKDGVDILDTSFNTFDYLYRQAGEIDSMIDNYRNVFVNCEIWELVDHLSDIYRKLDTVNNLSRWTRSSRTNRYSNTIKVDYIQRQLESLEDISRKSGVINYNDSWVDIAIENNLYEETYTSSGGVSMSISFKNSASFDIKNVVDTLNGTNIYGKDIVKKLTIGEDGDYDTLAGFDSLMQTFGTILSTMKGSIPEFPEDGTASNPIGSNYNLIGFPSIFRNLMQMFQKDDRFTSVDLLDLKVDQDQVFMVIRAKTKIGEKLISNVLL